MKLRIIQDEDPSSPREWDNLGTMVCWHTCYNLGDKHEFKEPGDFRIWWYEHNTDGKGVLLPLYLYDHSGITIATKPFSCPWDSGQVGYIYVLPDKLKKEFGSAEFLPAATKAKAEDILRQEVSTYDQFLRGDVWGYIVEDEDGNHLDSCWGFFGRDYAEQQGQEALRYAKEHSFDPVI